MKIKICFVELLLNMISLNLGVKEIKYGWF